MKSLDTIKTEIKELGSVYLFWTKKEIKYLPEVMKDDEHILYLTSGLMSGTTWLIVCTEERILLLDKGMLFGMKHTELPLDRVNSISYRTGLIFGSIEIWHGGAVMIIENCKKSTVKPFVKVVSDAVKKIKQISKATSSDEFESKFVEDEHPVDIAGQLERLAKLVEKGVLSKAEFEIQKKRLLNS